MNVCRICLNPKPRKKITQLMLQPNETEEMHSYEEIVEFCLGLKVAEDATSTKLCTKCFNKIIDFYQFKALAIKNDAHLRSESQNDAQVDTIVKEEYSEVDVSDNDFNGDEPLIYAKEECEQEDFSDDEVLSVLKSDKENLVKNDENIEGKIENKDDVENLEKVKGTGPKSKAKINVKTSKKGVKSREKAVTQPLIRICDLCGKGVTNLSQHRSKHIPPEERKYECQTCGKLLASKASLNRHTKYRHLNVLEKCKICGKGVKDMRAHLGSMHNPDSLRFPCPTCGRKFFTQFKLDIHMTVHSNNRPFKCEYCGKGFRVKITMQSHIRQVHEKELSHLCQYCSKRFFKKNHLIVHMRTHTKEKPYECDICHKKYQTSSSLKSHKHTHSTEKKYHCDLCDSNFITSSYLDAHMKSHIKEKKFPCQYCDVRFHRSDHRKRHEFTAHLKHTQGFNSESDDSRAPYYTLPRKRRTAKMSNLVHLAVKMEKEGNNL